MQDLAEDPLPLNYIGSTWSNQFLICSLLRSANRNNAMDTILGAFARDMEMLEVDGISNSAGNEHIYIQLLGLKGDLPALKTAGNMLRSYNKGPKQASGKTPCAGICWLCLAGQEHPVHVPFEDFRGCAAWKETCHVQLPWDQRPAILGNLRRDWG